ncbi:MAG TPA: M18 family aminopeptidase, partial [Pseudomonadaceae bacterium]|nr:M18 family aminopeptidase [Pseudomonadaceae bacterium]
MKSSGSIKGLCSFIGKSPTPFHAVSQMVASLEAAGWSRLAEGDSWQVEAGGRYIVTRNDSSLVALRLGTGDLLTSGLRMIGAHTDSPCLKVK